MSRRHRTGKIAPALRQQSQKGAEANCREQDETAAKSSKAVSPEAKIQPINEATESLGGEQTEQSAKDSNAVSPETKVQSTKEAAEPTGSEQTDHSAKIDNGTSPEAKTQPISPEQAELLEWFRSVRFQKKLIGGVDEAQLWRKLEELNRLYDAAIRAERTRYDVLLAERTASLTGMDAVREESSHE